MTIAASRLSPAIRKLRDAAAGRKQTILDHGLLFSQNFPAFTIYRVGGAPQQQRRVLDKLPPFLSRIRRSFINQGGSPAQLTTALELNVTLGCQVSRQIPNLFDPHSCRHYHFAAADPLSPPSSVRRARRNSTPAPDPLPRWFPCTDPLR